MKKNLIGAPITLPSAFLTNGESQELATNGTCVLVTRLKILKNVAHCLYIFIVILHCVVLNTLALVCMLQSLTGPLPVEPDGCAFHSIFKYTG